MKATRRSKVGRPRAPGATSAVAAKLARELIATGKAEAAQPLPAQTGPMTTETNAPLVNGKRAKEKPNAGE